MGMICRKSIQYCRYENLALLNSLQQELDLVFGSNSILGSILYEVYTQDDNKEIYVLSRSLDEGHESMIS